MTDKNASLLEQELCESSLIAKHVIKSEECDTHARTNSVPKYGWAGSSIAARVSRQEYCSGDQRGGVTGSVADARSAVANLLAAPVNTSIRECPATSNSITNHGSTLPPSIPPTCSNEPHSKEPVDDDESSKGIADLQQEEKKPQPLTTPRSTQPPTTASARLSSIASARLSHMHSNPTIVERPKVLQGLCKGMNERIRKACVAVCRSKHFERTVLAVIFSNCITLVSFPTFFEIKCLTIGLSDAMVSHGSEFFFLIGSF